YITPVSIVPYQEILLLGLLFGAFYFALRGTQAPLPNGRGSVSRVRVLSEPRPLGSGASRWMAAAVFLALACLTRFEAWAACPVLRAAWFSDGPRTVRRAFPAAAMFGAAPIVWIAARHGLSPQGSFVLDRGITLARFARYTYLAAHTAVEATIP